MADIVLSPSVELAWQLAGDLALRNQDPFIEPSHLLFGLCTIERLSKTQDKLQLRNPEDAARVRADAERLGELSRRHEVDLTSIRRAIREAPPAGPHSSPRSGPGRTINRSPAAKQVFENAAGRLGEEPGELGLLALFRAVIEAHDPQIDEIIASQPKICALLRELQAMAPESAQFNISLDPQLTDLDKGPEAAFETVVQIAEAVPADARIQPQAVSATTERLTFLSEVTWEFGTHGSLEPMLQRSVEQLLRIVKMAQRCAILVRDTNDSEMLLKAHGPAHTTPRISMTSALQAITEKKGFIWTRGENLTLSQKESNIEAGMYIPLVVNGGAIGVICLDSAVQSERFVREDLLLVTSFAHQVALAIANHELRITLKQNADILERLLTNFSPKIRTRLLQRAQLGRLRLGGEQSTVSILCCDIRGFARLTAGMDAEDVVTLLNEYFAALGDCVFRHDGTIDKFVGDAILAVFGSPEPDPQHCRKAVVAGMEMQQTMERVSRQRALRGDVACQIGIGIHTGEVLHGFIGSQERMEYTVIGDAVNRAARYCDGAKAAEVLISPEVYERVWKLVEAEPLSIATKHEGELTAYRVKRLRSAA